MKKKICFILLLSLSLLSQKALCLSVLEVEGASQFKEKDSKYFIYGGLAGDFSQCEDEVDGELSELCNSCKECTEEEICNCNEKRIYPNLKLKISVVSDSVSGELLLRLPQDDGDVGSLDVERNAIQGTPVTLEVYWKEICIALGATESCENILPSIKPESSLILGIDGNSDGDLSDKEDDFIRLHFRVFTPEASNLEESCESSAICGLAFFKGDRKVILKDLLVSTRYPSVRDDLEVERVRVMHSREGFPTDPTKDFVDIDPEELEEVEEVHIKGFENAQRYFFRFATIDEAENIAFFQSRVFFDSKCPDLDKDCDYAVTPEEVGGFLLQDKNCFIATATLDSSLHSHIDIFREFRNKILLKTHLGKKLALSYYRWGPKGVWLMEKHPALKSLAQVFLWLLWLLCYLILHPIVMVAFACIGFFVVALKKRSLLIVFFLGSSSDANLIKGKLISIQTGFYKMDHLVNKAGDSFETFYNNKPVIFLLDYEIPLSEKGIHLGLRLGTGLSYNRGKGQFKRDRTKAEEGFSFWIFPHRASLIARIKLPQSLLVPFAEAGAGYSMILEKRDDGLDSSLFVKRAGATTAHLASGVAIDLARDRATLNEIQEDYGLRLVYLYAEFRKTISLKEDFDLGSNTFSVGFVFGL